MTVTVTVPTMAGRADQLIDALDSIGNQTVRDTSVWVMPDGPDPGVWPNLQQSTAYGVQRLMAHNRIKVLPLGRTWAVGWGAPQRLVAGYLCQTEFMAYLDDDNTWESDHLEVLLDAIDGCDFAFAQMRLPSGQVIGDRPEMGHIDTSLILHRTDLLRTSTWDPSDGYIADGNLVERWVKGGARYVHVPSPTVNYRHREHRR